MIMLGVAFAIGFWGGVAFIFGAIAYYLRKWTLSPIAIPKTEEFKQIARREWLLTSLLLGTFFLFPLWLIGIIVLLRTYLIGAYRHLRSRMSPPAPHIKVPPVPIIPRFSLSELMAIVFSFGCAPAILLAPASGSAQKEV